MPVRCHNCNVFSLHNMHAVSNPSKRYILSSFLYYYFIYLSSSFKTLHDFFFSIFLIHIGILFANLVCNIHSCHSHEWLWFVTQDVRSSQHMFIYFDIVIYHSNSSPKHSLVFDTRVLCQCLFFNWFLLLLSFLHTF